MASLKRTNLVGGVNSDVPVPFFHEESNGTTSKFPASIVLEILAAESGGGRRLVAYSTCLVCVCVYGM